MPYSLHTLMIENFRWTEMVLNRGSVEGLQWLKKINVNINLLYLAVDSVISSHTNRTEIDPVDFDTLVVAKVITIVNLHVNTTYFLHANSSSLFVLLVLARTSIVTANSSRSICVHLTTTCPCDIPTTHALYLVELGEQGAARRLQPAPP